MRLVREAKRRSKRGERRRKYSNAGATHGRAGWVTMTISGSSAIEGERHICSIYRDRPRACRRFVCRLHERHRREGGPIEARLVAVRRVRELISDLEASRLTAADFGGECERMMSEALEDFARG
jgi:hypothetical protein